MKSLASDCFESFRGSLKNIEQVLLVTLALFLTSLAGFSQASQGTIQGAVSDQSGGAVAGAAVTVTDVARGVTRALVTDDAGQYVASNLTPSTYTVRAATKGFRTVEHSCLLVEVGQNIRVDLVVQPGEQTQTITVTGEVPAIDTTDATLGGTVSNESINALPLNGRNFERLLQLRPGVYVAPGSGGGGMNTNGLRRGDDLFLVDGLAQIDPTAGSSLFNATYRGGDSASVLPIDALQEFNTEQNPKAEYGWRDGSVVDVGVKSGINSLHGTAYAFGRNDSLGARPRFSV
jgi:Carboxypeptidase regulatory-like domain